jgi:hypothetical protein
VVHAGLLAEGSEGQAPLTPQLLHPGAESHDNVASCLKIPYTLVEVNSTHSTVAARPWPDPPPFMGRLYRS